MQDLINKIKDLAKSIDNEAGDDIFALIDEVEGRLAYTVATVRHMAVGDGFVGVLGGHQITGKSIGDVLRLLADAAEKQAPDGTATDRLAAFEQCLAETDGRLENLAAAMREVARKDSIHPSVRFLADTIAINLAIPHGRSVQPGTTMHVKRSDLHDPPGMPLTSSVGPLANDTSGRWLRMWSYPGAGNRVWGSEAEARAAAWEDYNAASR